MSHREEAFRQVLEAARQRRGAALMGICNVTPDSFSDGGRYATLEAAFARVDELIDEGADVIDVGGESTRPGAEPVPADEQLARVLEVVRYAAERVCVSIDTSDPRVAAACVEAGAAAVNDVSCLRDDELARVCAATRSALVLMHARGTQTAMRGFGAYPEQGYGDVVADVIDEWSAAAARAMELGVHRRALLMDPGLGFHKSARQSFELLRRVSEIAARVDVPILIGASRKSFLTLADTDAKPDERLGASIAAAVHAVRSGASMVRVHDVRATRQAMELSRLLAGPRESREATVKRKEPRC